MSVDAPEKNEYPRASSKKIYFLQEFPLDFKRSSNCFDE